jgi:hypothetical protein
MDQAADGTYNGISFSWTSSINSDKPAKMVSGVSPSRH